MISYCLRCLNSVIDYRINKKTKDKIRSSHPALSRNKLCSVCNYEKKKYLINWDLRKKHLDKICLWSKKNSLSQYDCIIPVSGGKDSVMQAYIVRDKLKMKPLLLCLSYPPEQLTQIGATNLSNLISLGFDCITISLDPLKWKEFTKRSFEKFGNLLKPAEMALYGAPVNLAIKFKIPLMFYGENPVYTISHSTKKAGTGGSGFRIQEENTIKGGPKSLKFKSKISDFEYYSYPTYNEMKKAKLKIIYLGYFLKNWSGKKNAKFAISKGLKIRSEKPSRIGDLWGVSALDDNFRFVNQRLRYLKKGSAHVTDQVCEAIQRNEMTRNEAIKLVEKYDGKCDEIYIKKFCKYIGISLHKYYEIENKFVNKFLFKKKGDKWIRKFKVGVNYNGNRNN
jgi:N-acetyl sugar amidotransferase